MFEQALKATANLTGKVQNGFLVRLDRVRSIGRQFVMEWARTWMFCFPKFDLSVHARGASWK
jgi:hypothetical protein